MNEKKNEKSTVSIVVDGVCNVTMMIAMAYMCGKLLEYATEISLPEKKKKWF